MRRPTIGWWRLERRRCPARASWPRCCVVRGQLRRLAQAFWLAQLPPQLGERVETHIKYEGYLDRQAEEARRFRAMEETPLPPELTTWEFQVFRVKSSKTQQRRDRLRSAKRAGIPGVTPAAVSILMVMARTQRAV